MKENTNYCSFTDWSEGINIPVTYSDVNNFSDKFVFVALNPTRDCHAFHSGSKQDTNLKFIFDKSNNVFYITDLIKLNPETVGNKISVTKAKDVVNYAKDNNLIDEYIGTLKFELSLIGGNPTIIAFGNKVYELLLENRCKLCDCRKPVKIKKVLHFSRNNKEDVKQQLAELGVFEKMSCTWI